MSKFTDYLDIKKYPLTSLPDWSDEETEEDKYEAQFMSDILNWSMLIDGYLNGEELTDEIEARISELEDKLEANFLDDVKNRS